MKKVIEIKDCGVFKIDFDLLKSSFLLEAMSPSTLEHMQYEISSLFEFYEMKDLLYTFTSDEQRQRVSISPIRQIDKYALKGLLSDD